MDEDSDGPLATIASESVIQFIGFGLQYVISFTAIIIMARILGRSSFGEASIGITILSIGSTLATLGLSTGISRFLPRIEHEKKSQAIVVTFGVVIVSSVSLVLILTTVADFTIFYLVDSYDYWSITTFILAIPLAALMKVAVGGIRGTERAAPRVLARNIVYPLVRFISLVILLYLGIGSLGVAFSYALAYASAAVVAIVSLQKSLRYSISSSLKNGINTDLGSELVYFSLPLAFSLSMRIIFSDVDILMLGWFATDGDVGMYNALYPLAAISNIVLTSVGYIYLPVSSRVNSKGISGSDLYRITTKWIFLFTVPIATILILYSNQIITLAYGSEYSQQSIALVVLALGFLLNSMMGPNLQVLVSSGLTRQIATFDAIAAIINVIMNLLLIPDFKILGAAFATATSYFLLNILYSVSVYMTEGYLPFNRDNLMMIAFIMMSIGIFAIAKNIFTSLAEQALLVVILVLVYLLAAAFFVRLEETERKVVNSLKQAIINK